MRATVFVHFLLFLGAMAASAAPLPLNPNTRTYDHHPFAAQAEDGTIWLSWHAYRAGVDAIFARRISGSTVDDLVQVNTSGNVHGPPQLVAHGRDDVSIVWPSFAAGRWQVLLRQQQNGQWQKVRRLSDPNHDAILPAATRVGRDGLFAVWTEFREGTAQLYGGLLSDPNSTPIALAPTEQPSYRASLAVSDGRVWVVWDQQVDRDYAIFAREVHPQLGRIERVSPLRANCLKPAIAANATGLHVAWLQKRDVIDRHGVVSQWHTLHAARRSRRGWVTITSRDGGAAAELTQGLMAQTGPRPVATGGYLGARTRPMWAEIDGRLHLSWERKSDHRGSTATVTGDMVARAIVDDTWQPPTVLSRGRLDYHWVHDSQNQPRLLGSQSPRNGLRRYELFDLQDASPAAFHQDAWPGWQPVALPIRGEVPPRRSITLGAKTYQLYWADLHCHNGLTADAEGEPDEQHVYARDRAQLDVVVFTNNDFYLVPLTQYEFKLGNLFARKFSAKTSAKRKLLSLPGFEWTSRIPGAPGAQLSDSGNWLPPYRNRSYPNHRSVIYPPSGGPLVHFPEVGNNINRLNQAVQAAGGITLSQHENFKLSGHAVEVGLELTSGWRNYIASHPNRFHEPLNRGARLGFTANGDTHRRAPGLSGALTGIYAESLDAESILEALRARRCYATMGSRIFLDARANGVLMGQEVKVQGGGVRLTLRAIGTRAITKATLIRNGEEVHTVLGSGGETLSCVYDDRPGPGNHWYYWRVAQARAAAVLPGNLMPAHGHLAWSTPHWVVGQ